MAQHFRTAFNGFNKEDVVRYLEYINNKHQNQVNQLNTEMEELRACQEENDSSSQNLTVQNLETQNQELRTQLDVLEGCNVELRTQLDALEGCNVELSAQKDALETRCAELAAQKEALETRCAKLTAQLENAPKAQEPVSALAWDSRELDAYRQAERIQKEARDRVELVYFQANHVLTEANAKLDHAAGDMTALVDQVMQQITQLQIAVTSGKQTLQEAAALLTTIRPNR